MVTQPKPGRPEHDEYAARLFAIRQLLATQGAAEEVVLASEDPSVTPARLVIGEHGPTVDMGDGVRLSLAGVGEEEGLDADALVDAQRSGLLGLIRRPELAVRSAYRHSGLRRLLRRVLPRLREYEDNISIAAMLEEAYGAPSGLRHRLRRFVRRNILLTLSVCAGVIAGGQLGATALIDAWFASPAVVEPQLRPAPETPATDEPGADESIAQAEPTRPPDPQQVLAHCAVTPHARTAFAAAGESEQRDLLREMHRFQQRLEATGIDDVWRTARARHAAIAAAGLPALDAIAAALAAYRSERAEALAELSTLETAYRASRDPARLREVDAVNRSIRLRDALAALEARLRDAPGENALHVVEAHIDMLRDRLGSGATGADSNAPGSDVDEAFRQEIASRVARELVAPAGEIDLSAPALARVRLGNLTEGLIAIERSVADAYDELRTTLDRIAVEEESANRRFATLDTDSAGQRWIGADGCLRNIQLAVREF